MTSKIIAPANPMLGLELAKLALKNPAVLDSAIAIAAQGRSVRALKLFIDAGADIHSRIQGFTPLHWAAESGRTSIARYLLDQGADVNAGANRAYPNTANICPLHLAAENGHIDMVELLLNSGAYINAEARYLRPDPQNFTPLHLAIRGQYSLLAQLLISNGADVNIDSKYHHFGHSRTTSTLDMAFEYGQSDIVPSIIERISDVVDEAPSTGPQKYPAWHPRFPEMQPEPHNRTSFALEVSVKHGSLAAVNQLLDQGADVQRKVACTPLHAAAERGFLEIAKVLVARGADVTAVTKGISRNETPLDCAIRNDQPAMVAFLEGIMPQPVKSSKPAPNRGSPKQKKIKGTSPQ